MERSAMRDGACVVTALRCCELRSASCRLLVLNLNHLCTNELEIE